MVVPWLVAVLAAVLIARRRRLSTLGAAVAIVGVSWAFAIVAASLFPFPLPPYGQPLPGGDGAFQNLPNLWLNPLPFHTIAKAIHGGFGAALAIGNVVA